MAIPSTYRQVILKNAPVKDVNVSMGTPTSTFAIEEVSFPEIKDNQVAVKVTYLLNDPTQRSWIQKGADAKRMYTAPVLEGEPVKSLALGEVVASKNEKYSVGDVVAGVFGWKEYSVIDPQLIFSKVDLLAGVPLPFYLSSLGMTGLTAYFGTVKVGQLQKDQSIIVSAALGATGSMVVQIAKHIIGAKRVIGFAGSDDKCKWVESIGADRCINYHDLDFKQQLEEIIGDDFVDVYYDNVGGEILDLCLTKVKPFGRVVACGAISGYNDHEKIFVKQWGQIITNRLTVQGFIVSDFSSEFGSAVVVLADGLNQGKISADGAEVVEIDGDLEKIPEVWSRLFSTKGKGKLLTKI